MNVTDEQFAQVIVGAVFDELEDRGGFNDWWCMIDQGTQEDIICDIADRILPLIAGRKIYE